MTLVEPWTRPVAVCRAEGPGLVPTKILTKPQPYTVASREFDDVLQNCG